jgi:rubredoxin
MPNLKKQLKNAQEDLDEKRVLTMPKTALNEDGETEQFNLLHGYCDAEGVVHKTFTLREMTGKDEEQASAIGSANNGSKVVALLLERCVKSIGTITRKSVGVDEWSKIFKKMLVGDLDYMMLKLREISLGGEFEASNTCPNCKASLKTFISTDELEITPFGGEDEIEFCLPRGFRDKDNNIHKEGTMRLPTGEDREILTPVAVKNASKGKTLMLTRVCKFKDGYPVTEEIMSSLTLRDREYLQKLIEERFFGIKPTFPVTCTSCGLEFEGSLGASNFI